MSCEKNMQSRYKLPEVPSASFYFSKSRENGVIRSEDCLKKRILYIDDEDSLLEIGKLYLERSGNFFVTVCNDPMVAYDLINTNFFDAIVSDYEMPGMNGIELLILIRKYGHSVPFIIFTGKGREEVVIQALNEGADFYIQKGGDNNSQFAELIHKITVSIERNQALSAKMESEHRLSHIISAIPDATFAIDTNHRVIAWNRKMEGLTGISEYDMIGKGDFLYSLPFTNTAEPGIIDLIIHDFPDVEKTCVKFIRENLVITAEKYVLVNSGEKKVRICAAPLYSSQNFIIGAIATIQEISEGCACCNQLEMYKQIALLSPDWEYWENPSHDILYCSPASLQLTGYKPEQFISSPSLVQDIIHPDDLELYLDHIRTVENTYFFHPSFEFRIVMKCGNIRWIERNTSSITGMNNQFMGTLVSNRDITQRKEREKRLNSQNIENDTKIERIRKMEDRILEKNSLLLTTLRELRVCEQKFQTLLYESNEGIVIFQSGTIVECNNAFLNIFGYLPDEKKTITLDALIPYFVFNPDVERTFDYENSGKGENSSFECDYLRKNGTFFSAKVWMKRIRFPGSNLLMMHIEELKFSQ